MVRSTLVLQGHGRTYEDIQKDYIGMKQKLTTLQEKVAAPNGTLNVDELIPYMK